MSPDDPRHGTEAGYGAHKRAGQASCLPCMRGHMIAQKRRQLHPPKVTTLGTQRRVQALQAIGYSRETIARRMGYANAGAIGYFMKPTTKTMYAKTAARVAEVYEALSMIVPEGPAAIRARSWAKRHGYVAPLWWDNIDLDPEPCLDAERVDVDPVVVMRLLEGQRVPSTKAEKDAAMEQWVADGGSKAELCRWHGWRDGRYGRPKLRVVEGGAA